jgi:CRISPR-associated exonuclease Cas4
VADHIAVSDLVHCQACPLRYYYEQNESRTESDRYTVCKQVSYHLGTPLDPEKIWQEVTVVRPAISPEYRSFFDSCITACAGVEWKPASQTDLRVVSEQYGIVGMVDRILPDNAFAVVRSVGALPFGTFGADRLRITAYALCLGEMTGDPVDGGYVEYIPSGVSRHHTIQPRDRRQFFATLRKARSVREGDIPSHPLNAPCGRCKYRGRCDNSCGRRLSDLF